MPACVTGPLVPAGLGHWTHFFDGPLPHAQLDAQSHGHSAKGNLYTYIPVHNLTYRMFIPLLLWRQGRFSSLYNNRIDVLHTRGKELISVPPTCP